MSDDDNHPDSWMLIDEWCARRRISRSSYYKLKRHGMGPEEVTFPGCPGLIRITPAADRRWGERFSGKPDREAAQFRRKRALRAAELSAEVRRRKAK